MTHTYRNAAEQPLLRALRLPPVPSFGRNLPDPSTLDLVSFYDYSYDPAQRGIGARVWDFGDGVVATSANPEHRFAEDGDYVVTLTVWTPDRRSASTRSSLAVRTHDVSIVHFDVQPTCRPGETVEATVAIVSTRYPETVEIRLLQRAPDEGTPFEQIGRETIVVPADTRTHPTRVTFRVAPDTLDGGGGTTDLK